MIKKQKKKIRGEKSERTQLCFIYLFIIDREKQINDLKSKMKSVEQTNKLLRNSISGLEHRKTELTESLARLKAEEKRYKPLLLKFWSIISMTISSPPTTDSAP